MAGGRRQVVGGRGYCHLLTFLAAPPCSQLDRRLLRPITAAMRERSIPLTLLHVKTMTMTTTSSSRTYYLLHTAYYILLTTYHLLLTTHYLLKYLLLTYYDYNLPEEDSPPGVAPTECEQVITADEGGEGEQHTRGGESSGDAVVPCEVVRTEKQSAVRSMQSIGCRMPVVWSVRCWMLVVYRK